MTRTSVRLHVFVAAVATAGFLAACTAEQSGTTPAGGQPAGNASAAPAAQAGSPTASTAADTGGRRGMNGMPATGGTNGMQGMKGMNGMPGMKGMHGMQGMGGGDMMAQMHAHMGMMQGAGADRIKGMLPMHRQMLANMLAQMTGEMRDMHMPADAQWTATVDSLRHDLVQMPEMSGAELKAMMPAHMGRVMRLMDLHRAMSGGAGQSGTGPTPARPGA